MSEGRFSRWSRIKRAGEAAEAPAKVDDAVEEAAPEGVAPDDESEDALALWLEKLDLPHPDSLVKGDDFSRFMARGVPRFVRNRALRKLWVSNPVLACVDGLNDYDTDFTIGVGPVSSSYKVGEGFAQRVSRAVKGTGKGTDMPPVDASVTDNPAKNNPVEDDYVRKPEPPHSEARPDETPLGDAEATADRAGERHGETADATPDTPSPAPLRARHMTFDFD